MEILRSEVQSVADVNEEIRSVNVLKYANSARHLCVSLVTPFIVIMLRGHKPIIFVFRHLTYEDSNFYTFVYFSADGTHTLGSLCKFDKIH